MTDRTNAPSVSRQEAVQPSLWDRLVDDLPGLVAESDALRRDLVTEIMAEAGSDRADAEEDAAALIAGGARAIERREDLSPDTRQLAHRVVQLTTRRRRLEESGVIVTADVLREAVRRDIEMLFNIERMEAKFLLSDREALDHPDPTSQLADFPEVRASVLNYGVPSFSGRMGSDFDKDDLAREIKAVLNIYEPRLKKESVKVRVRSGEKTGLRIDIDGVLLLSPVPERLRLSTSIDLDNGQAMTALEVR
ncbi:type VI secretion system baseplate subunit TssE [Thalassococcus profundi]|uniref:type VI secretion system baseplate subunit TssE n=1 Tax=Thalassococcus profundi TaxID=2282382 RepID=UPI001F290080|nr:type VI secretion system baseplate subunit TssE [Thalassococcus profundi]